MDLNTKDKKQIGLITSYYLSRCDVRAVKALGYKGWNEAFKEIGDILNINPHSIKNMRDEFDPYFDNPRAGWYQRALTASRKDVFETLKSWTDIEVEILVKKMLKSVTGEYFMETNSSILKDLCSLIRQSTIHYNEDFKWQDVELTSEFKDAYEEHLDRNNWKIEYFNATSVITTPTAKNIFVPNQWFVMASYAVGVYSELARYKGYFERIADAGNMKRDEYAKQLRDNASSVDKVIFIDNGKQLLCEEYGEQAGIDGAANRLWRFATDYSWWSGQKTIDRGDFYLSVVLNMLNLVNASQGYVGDIVNAYGSDEHLMKLTKSLDSFTTNMEGDTYDIVIHEDPIKDISEEVIPELKKGPTRSKISISQSSITRIGGK